MQAEEWRKRSGKAWDHVGNIDNDEEVVEVSPLLNKLLLGSAKLQEHNKSADMVGEHLGSERVPLGLRLNKDDLLKMIEKDFAQDARADGRHTTTDASIGVSDIQSSVTTPSLKPSKFHAYILRIGTWQWTSRYDGDLVAKFYFANSKLNSKLVWEILDGGLKRKIEIDSTNISALKLTCPEGQLGTLEIMLSQRPRFSRETTSQQPGKSTTWLGTTDFTGGQASTHRRHFLQCAPVILNKHIVKLLSSNHHLYSLSQENTIAQQNPYFEQNHSESQVPENSDAQARSQTSMVTGAPSGGLQQHCNFMFNWCNSSSQMSQNPYFEKWCSEIKIPESSTAHDLYRSYDYQQFGGTTIQGACFHVNRNKCYRGNQNGSQDKPILVSSSGLPSGGLEQYRNMFNWSDASLQTLGQAQLTFSSGTISGGLQQRTSMLSSSSSSLQMLPRQAQLNISSGSSSTREMELSHYALYNTTSQTLKQQVRSATTDAMELEKISHDLLDDIDMEPTTGAGEEAMVMSTVNSLSNLLQHGPAPATAGSSQASNAHAGAAAAIAPPINVPAEEETQSLGVAPDAGSSGAGGSSDNSLLQSTGLMAGVPSSEQEPMVGIDMDLVYLSEFLPFYP